jgi:hypothetical protein
MSGINDCRTCYAGLIRIASQYLPEGLIDGIGRVEKQISLVKEIVVRPAPHILQKVVLQKLCPISIISGRR